MSERSGGAPTGAGRYERSSNGLIGSMIVVVLVVVGVVVVRGFLSRDLDVRPEAVDYLDTVYAVQQSGYEPVYVPSLPQGWIATNVEYDPAGTGAFGLSLLTEEETFAGLRQEAAPAADLLARYVDPDDVDRGDDFETTGSVASTWQTWSDSGGDHAYTADVAGETVIVFGSAPDADLRSLVEDLTTAAAPAPGGGASTAPASPSATPSR